MHARMVRGTTVAAAAALLALAGASVMAVDGDESMLSYSVWGQTSVNLDDGLIREGLVGSADDVISGRGQEVVAGIRAGDRIVLGATFRTDGHLIANGDITIGKNGVVGGDVLSGDDVLLKKGCSVGGTVSKDVSPAPFGPLPVLPPASTFSSAGGTDVDVTSAPNPLPPGTYGKINLSNDETLTLTAGVYTLDQINGAHRNTINIDLSGGGEITIRIDDQVTFGNNLTINVIGGSPGDVLWEVHGNVNVSNSSTLVGTFFAPSGHVNVGSHSQIHGAVYAGGNVTLDDCEGLLFEPAGQFGDLYPAPSGNGIQVLQDDGAGSPVVGATVKIYRIGEPGLPPPVWVSRTGADGWARLDGWRMGNGVYRLVVSKRPGVPAVKAITISGGKVLNGSVRLTKVYACVSQDDGAAAPGVKVCWYQYKAPYFAWVAEHVADSEGETYCWLPDGTRYRFVAWKGSLRAAVSREFDVAAGGSTTTVSATLTAFSINARQGSVLYVTRRDGETPVWVWSGTAPPAGAKLLWLCEGTYDVRCGAVSSSLTMPGDAPAVVVP